MMKNVMTLMCGGMLCLGLAYGDMIEPLKLDGWTRAGQPVNASSAQVTINKEEGKIQAATQWAWSYAVLNLPQTYDLTQAGSSLSFSFDINNVPSTHNMVALLALINQDKTNALVVGAGEGSNSNSVKAGICTTSSVQNTNSNATQWEYFEFQHGSDGNTPTLPNFEFSSPYSSDKATVSGSLTCTEIGNWTLSMTVNNETKTHALTASNGDFSQIAQVSLSVKGKTPGEPNISNFTLTYSVPEPGMALLSVLGLGGLCLRRKK